MSEETEWNGWGLPPVGAEIGCNIRTDDGSYELASVVAHVPHRGETAVIIVYADGKDWNWATHDGDCFVHRREVEQ